MLCSGCIALSSVPLHCCLESMTAKCQHNIVNSCFRCCRVPFIHSVVPLPKHYLYVCSQRQIWRYFPAKTTKRLNQTLGIQILAGWHLWGEIGWGWILFLDNSSFDSTFFQKENLTTFTVMVFIISVLTKQLNLLHFQLLSLISVHSRGFQSTFVHNNEQFGNDKTFKQRENFLI